MNDVATVESNVYHGCHGYHSEIGNTALVSGRVDYTW